MNKIHSSEQAFCSAPARPIRKQENPAKTAATSIEPATNTLTAAQQQPARAAPGEPVPLTGSSQDTKAPEITTAPLTKALSSWNIGPPAKQRRTMPQPSRALRARMQYDREVMASLLQGRPVSDPAQLLQMIREGLYPQEAGIPVTASMDAVRELLLPQASSYPLKMLHRALSQEQFHALMDETLARLLMRDHCWLLRYLPERLLTPAFLDACIADDDASAPWILQRFPDHPIAVEILVRNDPYVLYKLPREEHTMALKKLAIQQDPRMISLFGQDPEPDFGELCMIALNKGGKYLGNIPKKRITPEMVERALSRKPIARLVDVPEKFLTNYLSDHQCEQAMLAAEPVRFKSYGEESPYPRLFLKRWPALMPYRARFFHWLSGLPQEERTESLCAEFVQQFPKALHLIPRHILQRHPEWEASAQAPAPLRLTDYMTHLPAQLRDNESPETQRACREFCNQKGAFVCLGPLQEKSSIPPWVLLRASPQEQARWLPPHLIRQLLRCGGPGNSARDWGLTTPLSISAEGLLCPVQTNLCPPEAAIIPIATYNRLQFCNPFVLPNQGLGWELQDRLEQHRQETEPQLSQAPVWETNLQTDQDWQPHGGRVLYQTGPGLCRRLKFLRAGEPLAEWLAESAVQDFALQHQHRLGLQSEIPIPKGFWRVPIHLLPQPVDKGMKSELAVQDTDQAPYYLAFEFTTCNEDYSYLAWQKDSDGGHTRGEAGMARAFHDLGVWSSLGVVHSSTAALFHSVDDKRPEVVLLELFFDLESGIPCYPGRLARWRNSATDQSDWGFSGLRDLGDIELYGTIASFRSWADTCWKYPAYSQRAAYVNIVCSNLLVGLLHYMRQNRDSPDWHYLDEHGCQRLAGWLDTQFSTFLQGLLGEATRLEHLFPDPACYRDWLTHTAREILYWSAPQNQGDKPCFAAHLLNQGRPCPSLYPGHPVSHHSYEEEYFDASGEECLGPFGGKLPLFSLVRGFHLLACKLADRLEGPDPTPLDAPVTHSSQACPPGTQD